MPRILGAFFVIVSREKEEGNKMKKFELFLQSRGYDSASQFVKIQLTGIACAAVTIVLMGFGLSWLHSP